MATTYVDIPIPSISLAGFESRVDAIAEEICHAAEHTGFFTVVDHGIATDEIDAMFALSEAFFALPQAAKETVPMTPLNVGYECRSQVRPSTGLPDEKESYQLQFGQNMQGRWIGHEYLPGFEEKSLAFMHRLQGVSEKLMVCFARILGFADDYFVKAHDVSRPNSQTALRLLHYFALLKTNDGSVYHRAGAHADWDFLTLLLQRKDQPGLEICAGRQVVTDREAGGAWTKIDCPPDSIVCNIGDLLMSWSDDRFKSTFHRVKAPVEDGDSYAERYSIAFFNQPCTDVLIQGPKKKYPQVTGKQFTADAIARNYEALKEKKVQA